MNKKELTQNQNSLFIVMLVTLGMNFATFTLIAVEKEMYLGAFAAIMGMLLCAVAGLYQITQYE